MDRAIKVLRELSGGALFMLVAGVDGCRAGWVAFEVEVVDPPAWLRDRPPDIACFGIDIPIGLLEGPRA